MKSASQQADAFLANVEDYAGNEFSGRGIVICGGGIKYGGCAWVLVRLLRHLGCRLPIEVWCLNDDEFDPGWVELIEPLGVTCINAADVRQEHPHRRLRGWELKPYAILHSRFQEVLFLDADNVPVVEPSFLFDIPEYQETGTLFWPDPQNMQTPEDSHLWKMFGTRYRPSPDQESGQLVIDKARCWPALNLCNWYNEHSDFYYQHVYGDKETFRFAWQRLEQPISWPKKFASGSMLFTLLQHDFAGDVLFQHRFYRKWSLYDENVHIPGFVHEEICLQFLAELRKKWNPQLHLSRGATESDREQMSDIAGQGFVYDRIGHNRWSVELDNEGSFAKGYGPNQRFWWIVQGCLVIAGSDGRRRCQLYPQDDGSWEGVVAGARRILIQLKPVPSMASCI